MIPDFPYEKEQLNNYWLRYLNKRFREFQGFFGSLPMHINHEGREWKIINKEFSSRPKEYSEIKGVFNIDFSEVSTLTPERIRQKLDITANNMAQQLSSGVFKEITKATKIAGNEINAEGKPLTKELFLETLSKIHLDFDDSGNWKPPVIIMHPDLWEAQKENFKSWENDKVFIKKFRNLIARKKEEWVERETNRKLVD